MVSDRLKSSITSLTNLRLSVSYCASAIVGSSVNGSTLATLFTHFPTEWTVKRSAVVF